jgi:hypothetical protein
MLIARELFRYFSPYNCSRTTRSLKAALIVFRRHEVSKKTWRHFVGSEVLTAVSTKMAVFWVVAPWSLIEVYQRFRGPCCLHHQGDVIGATTQKTAILDVTLFVWIRKCNILIAAMINILRILLNCLIKYRLTSPNTENNFRKIQTRRAGSNW